MTGWGIKDQLCCVVHTPELSPFESRHKARFCLRWHACSTLSSSLLCFRNCHTGFSWKQPVYLCTQTPVLRVCFQGTWPITPVKSLVKWLLHKSLKEYMFKITKSYMSRTFWITMIRWKCERYIWNGKDLLFVYVHIKERSCWEKMKPAQIGQFFLSCFSNYAFIPIDEYTGGFILLNMLEENIFILKHNKSILEKITKLKRGLKNKHHRKLMLVGKGGKQVEGEDAQLHLLGH